jgi:hypothetical protein
MELNFTEINESRELCSKRKEDIDEAERNEINSLISDLMYYPSYQFFI